jgi:hypothetical protein
MPLLGRLSLLPLLAALCAAQELRGELPAPASPAGCRATGGKLYVAEHTGRVCTWESLNATSCCASELEPCSSCDAVRVARAVA